MAFNDEQTKSLFSVFNGGEHLEISVSEHILRTRFWFSLLGAIGVGAGVIVYGVGYSSDIVKVASWSFLWFILIFLSFILYTVGLIHSAKAMKEGEAFTFDHSSDSIRHNSQRIAALSELQEVQLRIPPNYSSKPYPSVWIVTGHKKPIEVLDTGMLAIVNFNSGFGGIGLKEMITQMRAEAYIVARQIAQFANVPVREVCR